MLVIKKFVKFVMFKIIYIIHYIWYFIYFLNNTIFQLSLSKLLLMPRRDMMWLCCIMIQVSGFGTHSLCKMSNNDVAKDTPRKKIITVEPNMLNHFAFCTSK